MRNNLNLNINIIDINEHKIELPTSKLFREIENKKKLSFILQNTDITQSIIIKAQKLSNKNPYHNFGHQLGVTESAILIAKAQGLPKKDINLLSLVGLFHDASHTGICRLNDEEIAYEDMMKLISNEEIKQLGCTKNDIKRLILSTKFSSRGQSDGILEKIIQDSDLGSIGYGPYYMLYSTMGIVDEYKFSILDYVNQEKQFISYLENINSKIFLSDGANQVFMDPRESLKQISQWPQEVIDYAYSKKYEDISFADFKKNIDSIINRN
ncbi:HD domain-containing protein [Candidatus Gracilibacteria bacterium]|nr:HD domain-containing protein [Candidatus Gracilibacteria bacterium]